MKIIKEYGKKTKHLIKDVGDGDIIVTLQTPMQETILHKGTVFSSVDAAKDFLLDHLQNSLDLADEMRK